MQVCAFFEKLRKHGGIRQWEFDELFCDQHVTLSVLASHFINGNHQWLIEFDHKGEAFVIEKGTYVLHGESKKRGDKLNCVLCLAWQVQEERR